MPRTLRLILGDQLNYQHSWYNQKNNETFYLLMEMRQETDYVKHHAQKVVGIFAAMFNFANYLSNNGHQVIHLKINDVENTQSLTDNIKYYIERLQIDNFEYQEPDEYRLDWQLKEFCKEINCKSKMFSSEHFLTERNELAQFFEGKKMFLMETFYRSMRKKYNILLDAQNQPTGGKWNYDEDNRQKWKGQPEIPQAHTSSYDYSEIWEEIQKSGVKTIGNANFQKFIWPTTRKHSLQALNDFLKHRLPNFGKFQDAMVENEWAMFHSRISFSLNTKMIHPLEVVKSAIAEWESRPDEISLSSLEGFVRQIIGWREYMRGIYWAKMPEFSTLNFFNHQNKLPDWFWTGKTKMNCLSQSIRQSLEYAYAHHIQRLMITGNFALLAAIHPDEVDAWYLGIYIDAFEWVEITNTRGMSQFADGGIVGTKPYVSSANYIDKMSNYCNGCFYNKKEKTGEKSCPFNSLYWHFYQRNRNQLEKNPRIGMMYITWDKMSKESQNGILQRADYLLENLNKL